LGEHYEQKRERYAIDTPTVFDRDLRRIFTEEPRHGSAPLATTVIRRNRTKNLGWKPSQTAREAPPAASVPASGFVLEVNYPNPFRGGTTVGYRLSSPSEVELAVYDVLGRRVAVLASGVQWAGEHAVRFEASGLSSGVYLYRLEVGGRAETRQMIVMR
jgi:hypothetical protein